MTQDPNRLKARAPLNFVQQETQEQQYQQPQTAQQNASTVIPQYTNTVAQQAEASVQAQTAPLEEEKPTEKMTIYITKTQARKVRQMIHAYEEQTDQRTDQNKLMRKFIDKLDLSMII